MLAAQHGRADCVTALIAVKAEVNAQTNDGFTALMLAAHNGSADCVTALIAAKAKVNANTNNGDTALMLAALTGTRIASPRYSP